jgi:hypothetical protein
MIVKRKNDPVLVEIGTLRGGDVFRSNLCGNSSKDEYIVASTKASCDVVKNFNTDVVFFTNLKGGWISYTSKGMMVEPVYGSFVEE